MKIFRCKVKNLNIINILPLTKINTAVDGKIIFLDPASFNLKYNNITQMILSEAPSDAPALVRKNRSKLKFLMTDFQTCMQWPTEYPTD